MRTFRHVLIGLGAACAGLGVGRGEAQDSKQFSTERRIAWTSSRIKGTPDPPAPYRTVVAFPKLKFTEPLDMTSAPHSDDLFVVERFGRILTFPNDPDAADAHVFLEIRDTTFLGFAFHPDFANNRQVFVTQNVAPEGDQGIRVSRFHAFDDDPSRIDPDSEQILIEWPSGGHSGGCLQFGPDGMLYIGTGDSSGIADARLTGQDISDLSGSILRIDVDKQESGKPYGVPTDNPFVGVDGARPEVWAYGLRQPWKFTFDAETGDLWTGNVGQDLWEQIFLIERGGNYGWSVMEGGHPFRPDRDRGPSPFIPPVVEHDHAEFRSITGGYVYYGDRLDQLTGAYIYGDYDTGKIWMFRYARDAKTVSEHRELVDSALRLVGFAQDKAGELFLVDHMSGLISRLDRNPQTDTSNEFPRRLSETGLFSSVGGHVPAAGVIPYDVNAPQWCDGATKQRFLAIPDEERIEFDGITYPQPAPGAPHGWKFPDGTVAFETISMEMEPGNPASRKRLETRVLHYEQLEGSESVGDQYWHGYTYVWNDEQTDAVLLEEPLGRDVALSIRDKSAPGGTRTQTWHIPGRAECTVCHNMAAKYVLGINTLQMNREFDYDGDRHNQIDVLQRLKVFTAALPKSRDQLPRIHDYRDTDKPVADRARSYLHANCSHCHRKWGGGNGEFRLLATVSLTDAGISDMRPGHGGFLMPDARILSPGRPNSSVLYYRMAKLGPGRMPRLGSAVVDTNGLELIRDWIRSLDAGTTPDTTLASRLNGLTSSDVRGNAVDELLTTTGSALDLMHAVDSGELKPDVHDDVIARASAAPAAHIRDLFERYLPEEKRTKRLGTVIRPETILAIDGDPAAGEALFFKSATVQCRNCHRINNQGAEVGPDLNGVGKKYRDRSRLLDTILNPSREIDPKYRVHLVQTSDGRVVSGLLVSKTETEIVLKDAKGKLSNVPTADVDELIPQQQSMMPDLLLRDMTAQQVADLLAWLATLKAGTP